MYGEKLKEHKTAIESIQSIALTTDFWTSNNKESYCGITGHWIDSGWKLTSVALGCLVVDDTLLKTLPVSMKSLLQHGTSPIKYAVS